MYDGMRNAYMSAINLKRETAFLI